MKNELEMAHTGQEIEASIQTSVFQRFDEKHLHNYVLESTMQSIFHHLANIFEDLLDLINDLEAEVKSLSHEDIDGLNKNIDRLEVENV